MTTLYPRKIFTEQESGRISGEARHSWLCEGRLLHLFDAVSPHNIALFKHQWARGQPVLISKSDMYLNARLWHPNAFMQAGLPDWGFLVTLWSIEVERVILENISKIIDFSRSN